MNYSTFVKKMFYSVKPLIPRQFQLSLRSSIVRHKSCLMRDVWPIFEKSGQAPPGWGGWPGGKKFGLLLTHDVETASGQKKCLDLARLETKLGFRSVFNFVPERYHVKSEIRRWLTNNGFEVGVHGLNHDGRLFLSRRVFSNRKEQINSYLKEWKSVGFRSPSMHHNLDWIHELSIQYDSSTVDTEITELGIEGRQTIFPFWVRSKSCGTEYLELPVTMPQDFYLFVLMKEKNIDIWIQKSKWIIKKKGMVLINVHPDYMNFNGNRKNREQYPAEFYEQYLTYIKNNYEGCYYHPLPKDMVRFCADPMQSDPDLSGTQ